MDDKLKQYDLPKKKIDEIVAINKKSWLTKTITMITIQLISSISHTNNYYGKWSWR